MKKISIGIDPGKSGFMTVIGSDKWIVYYAMPLIKKQLDVAELASWFSGMPSLFAEFDSLHCVIEDVHAMFGSSAKSTFSFGYVCGVIEALLVSNKIPYTKVNPKTWQKEMWQGIPMVKKPSKSGKTMTTDTKAMSLMAAKRLFPNEDLRATERSTTPHDGKVDSLLIAEYCRRKFN